MKFTPLPKDSSRQYNEENGFMFKPCSRFNFFSKPSSDEKCAVVYLKLRSKSCGKLAAKTFCAKPICKVDSTRIVDGPPKFRMLNVKGHSKFTVNVI